MVAPAGLIGEQRARAILLATQSAWNSRDLRALAQLYTEDITYWTNWGGADNGPRTIAGRAEFIRHLAAIRDAGECTIQLRSFRLEEGQGRASFDVRFYDPESGLRHAATCRLIVTYTGDRISRIQEYHDASAMLAFAQMVRAAKPLSEAPR